MLSDNCAYTATARTRLALMRVDGPTSFAPNTVTVRAASLDNNGLFEGVDAQFDLLASC